MTVQVRDGINSWVWSEPNDTSEKCRRKVRVCLGGWRWIKISCRSEYGHLSTSCYLVQVETKQPGKTIVGDGENDEAGGYVAAEGVAAEAVLHAAQSDVPVGGSGGVEFSCHVKGWG